MLGTAPTAITWLLLEYAAPFARNALEESVLPLPVINHLNALTTQIPDCKTLLIRNQHTRPGTAMQLFVSSSNSAGNKASITQTVLHSYEELLDYPTVSDLISHGVAYEQPLVLVCTNGKRDQCCAKYGVPLFNELSTHNAITAFECSHVGQHRFAPNLIAFPGPYFYGRLTGPELNEFVSALENRMVYTPRLRGNASLSAPCQAAEKFLLSHLGDSTAQQIKSAAEIKLGNDVFRVTLCTAYAKFEIDLLQVVDETPILSSCEGDKTHLPSEFQLLEIREHTSM